MGKDIGHIAQPFDRGVPWNPNRPIPDIIYSICTYIRTERMCTQCIASACIERRGGVGRVTRSYGVRCVKWSTIPPGNYMYPILRRYLAYWQSNPTLQAADSRLWCSDAGARRINAIGASTRHSVASSSWHYTLTYTRSITMIRRFPDAPHAWALSHPSTASSSSSSSSSLLVSIPRTRHPHGPLILRFDYVKWLFNGFFDKERISRYLMSKSLLTILYWS